MEVGLMTMKHFYLRNTIDAMMLALCCFVLCFTF